MAPLSASAINIIGAGFIQLLNASIECFGIEVIQLLGTCQMTFCIFLWGAYIEEEAGGIRLCLVDKGLWSQYDDAVGWG